jgi:hypothetical protein
MRGPAEEIIISEPQSFTDTVAVATTEDVSAFVPPFHVEGP